MVLIHNHTVSQRLGSVFLYFLKSLFLTKKTTDSVVHWVHLNKFCVRKRLMRFRAITINLRLRRLTITAEHTKPSERGQGIRNQDGYKQTNETHFFHLLTWIMITCLFEIQALFSSPINIDLSMVHGKHILFHVIINENPKALIVWVCSWIWKECVHPGWLIVRFTPVSMINSVELSLFGDKNDDTLWDIKNYLDI